MNSQGLVSVYVYVQCVIAKFELTYLLNDPLSTFHCFRINMVENQYNRTRKFKNLNIFINLLFNVLTMY